jgi:hypothetical protein
MKRVIQCVYTQMEGDSYQFARTLDDQEIKDLLHQLATFDSSVKCLLPENSGDEKDTE